MIFTSYDLRNQIISVYHTDYKFFFSKPNVQGIGYGYKYTDEICTCEPSIHVFVSKKVKLNCLKPNALIPTLYRGIKTDVIETGIFTANSLHDLNPRPTTPPTSMNDNFHKKHPYSKKIRPIHPGYSMSTSYENSIYPHAGTLGYIVIDNKTPSKGYCLLSNNSTFANFNSSPLGTSILQPAYNFGGCAPRDSVARLLRYFPLKFSNLLPYSLDQFNTIDASIATYVNIRHSELINPFIPNIGIPKGINPPFLNMPIKWTGCILGTQYGIIDTVNSIIKVYYSKTKVAWFKDVFLASGIATTSDLGTLVCNNKLHALGILFAAGNIDHVCICNIKNVMDKLNVKLLCKEQNLKPQKPSTL